MPHELGEPGIPTPEEEALEPDPVVSPNFAGRVAAVLGTQKAAGALREGIRNLRKAPRPISPDLAQRAATLGPPLITEVVDPDVLILRDLDTLHDLTRQVGLAPGISMAVEHGHQIMKAQIQALMQSGFSPERLGPVIDRFNEIQRIIKGVL